MCSSISPPICDLAAGVLSNKTAREAMFLEPLYALPSIPLANAVIERRARRALGCLLVHNPLGDSRDEEEELHDYDCNHAPEVEHLKDC